MRTPRRPLPSGPPLTLKHFVLRSEALKLYRDALRACKGLDEATAAGVREAARERFADGAAERNVDKIRTLIVDGRHSLNEMLSYLKTTR